MTAISFLKQKLLDYYSLEENDNDEQPSVGKYAEWIEEYSNIDKTKKSNDEPKLDYLETYDEENEETIYFVKLNGKIVYTLYFETSEKTAKEKICKFLWYEHSIIEKPTSIYFNF